VPYKIKWLTDNLGKYIYSEEDEDRIEGMYIFRMLEPVSSEEGWDAEFLGYEVEFEVDKRGNVKDRAWMTGILYYDFERDWKTGQVKYREEEWEKEIRFRKRFKLDDFLSGKVDDIYDDDFDFV